MRISEKREIAIKEINKETRAIQKGIAGLRTLRFEVAEGNKLHMTRIDSYISVLENIIDQRVDEIAEKHGLNSTVLNKIINSTK